MKESKDCNIDIDIDVLFRRRRKRRKIFGEGEYLFSGGKENQRRKRRKIFGEDLSRILRSLGFGFCLSLGLHTFAIFWGVFGIRFGEFGLGKKVSFLVLENLVSEKKSRFQFQRIWTRKKSLSFGKMGIGRKASVSVSVKILVSSFSGAEARLAAVWDTFYGQHCCQVYHC